MRKIAVSPTLAINEAIARRRGEGKPVLPLGFGEAGLPVHPSLRAKLSAAAVRKAYGPVAGIPELREAAAGYWSRRNLPTKAEQIICGPGSKPLLYILMLAIGGDVAMAAPSWVSYAAQAHLLDVKPLLVPTLPGQGGVPNPDRLANAVERARAEGRTVRSVIVTLPDNPTGTLASPDTIRRLCQVAKSLDLIIISDEIYRDLVYDPQAQLLSPAEVAPERTVITTGLAKNLALGGWRIGIARVPDNDLGRELHAALSGLASEIWSNPSGPIQEAAAYAYTEPTELTERIEASRRLHSTLVKALTERFVAAGAQVATPQAAFYLYPDLENWRGHIKEAYNISTGAELGNFFLHQYGMGVLPASDFGEGPEVLRFRIATSLLYGNDDEQRGQALAAADPLELPWIQDSLQYLETVLAEVGAGRPLAATAK